VDAETMTVLNSFTELEIQLTEAAWSPDGSRLAIANGADVEVWEQVWNSELIVQTAIYQYSTYLPQPEPLLNIVDVAWSPDGAFIAATSGSVVDIWSMENGSRVHRLRGNWNSVYAIEWHSDERLAMATADETVIIVNPFQETLINYFFAGTSVTEVPPGFVSIASSPDGHQIAIGSGFGLIMLWGDTYTTETVTRQASRNFGNSEQSHSDYVYALSWSPTGQYLASGSQDGTVRLWDANTGEQLQVINLGEDAWVCFVAWSPDGSRLAYGNPDGSVTLFDATQLPGYAPMATAE
jgi:WD40 repeat protein